MSIFMTIGKWKVFRLFGPDTLFMRYHILNVAMNKLMLLLLFGEFYKSINQSIIIICNT